MKYIRTRNQSSEGDRSWSAFHLISQENPQPREGGVYVTHCGQTVLMQTGEQKRNAQAVFLPGLGAWICKGCILARGALS
jgi:hypothetical protein